MKNRLLFIAVFLPLLSFGNVYLYTFNSDLSQSVVNVPIPSQALPMHSSDYSNVVYSIYYNNFNGYYYGRRGYLAPIGTSSVPTNASSSTIDYQILVGPGIYCNPLFFSNVSKLYFTAESLYSSGYRSPGLVVVYESSNSHYVNFNFSMIVSDVFSSTNNTYQSLVLSALNSIHFSLSSIGSSVGYISSDSSRLLQLYESANPLSVVSLSNAVQSAFDQSLISEPLRSSFLSTLSEFSDPFYDQYPADRATAYNSVLRSLDSLGVSLGVFQDLENSFLRNPSLSRSALNHAGDFFGAGAAYHYTTPLTNEMRRLSTNVVGEVHAALSNNTAQIKDQLKHMFDNPSDQSTVGGGIANISRASGVLAGAVNNNRIMVTVENSTPVSVNLDGPINIDQSQFTQLSTPLAGLQSRIDTWYQDWYSFYSPNVSGHSWVDFFDLFSSFKLQNHFDFSSLSNLLASTDDRLRLELPNITNRISLSSSFSSLLHDDYSNFVEHTYSDILFNLQNQYPDVYEDLVNLGLEEDSYSGRWWTLQSSSLAYISAACRSNNTMIASVIGDILSVRSALESYSNGRSPFSLFSDVASSLPTQSKIDDFLDQATNAVNSIGVAGEDTLLAFSAYSNTAFRAFSIFNDSYSLPASITLLKLPNEHYVTVPVGSSPNVWRVMRWGISLGLVCVNIILFPKFFFYIVTLFMRLFRRSVKILPAERSFD